MPVSIASCLPLVAAMALQTCTLVVLPVMADVPVTPRHSLQDVAFIKGNWTSTSKGGAYVEEYWSGIEGDSMVGHCRMIKNGHTTFYEIVAIVNTPTGLVLRMRHFNEAMSPWKEEDESGDCPLISCGANEAVFGNGRSTHAVKVTYRRTGPKSLYALVEDVQEGKTSSYPFEYKLVK
jgi:hypothetical protein